MNKKRENQKAAWMREFQTYLLVLKPELAGKIDWDTATYLYNVGNSAEVAAKKVAETP